MIFVDTGAWYASVVVNDSNHLTARAWLNRNVEILVTTDYIIDETLTLLKVRGYGASAIGIGEMLFAGELADVILVNEEDIQHAWNTFRQFRDKEWSFTDCTSKVILERLGLTHAFCFDHHFRQFGSVTTVP